MRTLVVGDITNIGGLDGPGSRVHPREYPDWLEKQPKEAIICANNVLFADLFPANRIIVVQGNKQKFLSEHPKFSVYGELMTTGQFWSSVGEDWVK